MTYFRHSAKGAFLQSIFRLLTAQATFGADGRWVAKPGATGFEELRFLIHFAKMIRLKAPRPAVRRVAKTEEVQPVKVPKRKPSPAAVEAQMFKRKFGMPLQFVEEREWRIVHHPAAKGFVPGEPDGMPDWYLPYLPGEELFTLVLPDHKVVSRVLQEDWFTERLFTPWKHYPALHGRVVPPVTVLAHSDIGTY